MIFAEILHTKDEVLQNILSLYLDGRSSEEMMFIFEKMGYDFDIEHINDII
jgi:hypothetical protein